jgi:hypothetical protein
MILEPVDVGNGSVILYVSDSVLRVNVTVAGTFWKKVLIDSRFAE